MRLLLLAAIALTFGRILSSEFVDWDDGKLIYDNSNITQGTLEGLAHQWNWRDPNAFNLYDPLVYTTWWLLAHAAKIQTPDALGATINPQVFHAANLIVHWLAACVVLEILARIGVGGWPAAAGALLFAVHPLQTEAVAWATGMKWPAGRIIRPCDDLAVSGRGAIRRRDATEQFPRRQHALPGGAAIQAVGRRFAVDPGELRRGFVSPTTAPQLAVDRNLVADGRGRDGNQRFHSTVRRRLKPWPLWSRPFIAADALNFYLCKLLLPVHLSFDYGRTPLAMLNDPFLHRTLYWSWMFPAIAALFVWRLRRPMPAVAALVFFLGVLPVLGLIPFAYQYYSTVADRYVYLSMLGVAMAAAWVLARFGNRAVWCAAGGVLAALMSLSFLQAGVWKDTDTLYTRALSLNPTNGTHYLFVAEYEEKEADLAFRRRNLAMKQGNADRANAEDDNARRFLTKAVEFRRQEINYDPQDVEGHKQLSADLKFLGDAGREPR